MRLYIASNLFAGHTFACTYDTYEIEVMYVPYMYETEVFEFDTCSLFMNLIHAVYADH